MRRASAHLGCLPFACCSASEVACAGVSTSLFATSAQPLTGGEALDGGPKVLILSRKAVSPCCRHHQLLQKESLRSNTRITCILISLHTQLHMGVPDLRASMAKCFGRPGQASIARYLHAPHCITKSVLVSPAFAHQYMYTHTRARIRFLELYCTCACNRDHGQLARQPVCLGSRKQLLRALHPQQLCAECICAIRMRCMTHLHGVRDGVRAVVEVQDSNRAAWSATAKSCQ